MLYKNRWCLRRSDNLSPNYRLFDVAKHGIDPFEGVLLRSFHATASLNLNMPASGCCDGGKKGVLASVPPPRLPDLRRQYKLIHLHGAA